MNDDTTSRRLKTEIEALRLVTRLIELPTALCTRDFRYVWVNEPYARMVERTPSEIIGHTIADVLGAHAFADLRPCFERVLGGERVEFQTTLEFERLGARVMHAVYVPVGEVADEPTGWIATDDHSHALLAAIVENSDDAIVGKSLDGIITSWNEGARRIFGYTADEIIGQPIQRLMPPERGEDMLRILGRIRMGERVDHYETERIRKDGTRIQVSLTVSPIRDANGNVVGASKIARDVTERTLAQKALAESLALVATLKRTSEVLASELDLGKLVQVVTDIATESTGARFGAFFYNVMDAAGEAHVLCALSGASREAFESSPTPRNAAIFGPTFRDEGLVRLDDVRKGTRYGHNPPYEGMPLGHLPVASYLAAPVILRGEVLGGLFFGHPDPGVFTERQERLLTGIAAQTAIAMDNARLYAAESKARAEAESANRAKDELLSIVSHELRTPLSAMLGWVAVLRQGKLSPERTARALETIERSGRVQEELIDDLLDVSRVVSGRLKLTIAPTDLGAAIRSSIEAIRPDASAKGVVLNVSPSPDEAIVMGDSIRLQQIVSNVVGNAIKFTPAGKAVHVEVSRSADVARLIVRDEGEGIPPDFIPHVFEAFRQAGDVRTRKGGGLGLGLTIVRNLVDQHGGSIDVSSEGRDRGASFTVTLPLAPASAVSNRSDDDS